ncbi:hypothetical protein BFP70_13020 [Thioclava sp. SK-1]|uniref:hypothetical protein n=1 Tax=Thioclava sp. SK-1 TaxID=1889770 RepID=UPI00082531FC|nr:hypothetical protein [Thioclava sp. SK-1]OCX63125.1 hypothetical protein BFP70_13020 [Thioclava sp. SK-1]
MDGDFNAFGDTQLKAISLAGFCNGLRAVEAAYGPLQNHLAEDGFKSLLRQLSYSINDLRDKRPNPTRLPIDCDLYSQLATLRSYLRFYARYMPRNTGTNLLPALSHGSEAGRAIAGLTLQAQPTLYIPGMEALRLSAQTATGHSALIYCKTTPAIHVDLFHITRDVKTVATAAQQMPESIVIAPGFDARLVAQSRLVLGLALKRSQPQDFSCPSTLAAY